MFEKSYFESMKFGVFLKFWKFWNFENFKNWNFWNIKKYKEPVAIDGNNLNHNIGIIVPLLNSQDRIKKYEMAMDTIECYARYKGYHYAVLYVEENEELKNACHQWDVSDDGWGF